MLEVQYARLIAHREKSSRDSLLLAEKGKKLSTVELDTSQILIANFCPFYFHRGLKFREATQIPRIFCHGIYFQWDMLKFILTDPQGIILAELAAVLAQDSEE